MKKKRTKRTLAIILSSLIVSSSSAALTANAAEIGNPVAPPQGTTQLLGDANGDGEVTISDATLIQHFLAGMGTIISENMRAADVNSNGRIDASDATAIQLFLASYDYTYPIGQPIVEAPGVKLLGDANGDGYVTIKDATTIQSYVAGLGDTDPEASDVNGDGVVTVDDATDLQQFLSGLDYTYPIGLPMQNSEFAIAEFIAEGHSFSSSVGDCTFDLTLSGGNLKDDKPKSAEIIISRFGETVGTVNYLEEQTWTTELKGIFSATITVTDWDNRTATATAFFETQGSHYIDISYVTNTPSGEPMVGTPVVFSCTAYGVSPKYGKYYTNKVTIKNNTEEITVVENLNQDSTFEWTPQEPGTYNLTFERVGYGGGRAIKTIIFDVYGPLSAKLSYEEDGKAHLPISTKINTTVFATGGKAPYTFEVSKNASNPISSIGFYDYNSSIAQVTYSGTIDSQDGNAGFIIRAGVPGAYKIDLKITDALGQTETRTITLNCTYNKIDEVSFSNDNAVAGEKIGISASVTSSDDIDGYIRYEIKDPKGGTTTLAPSSRYGEVKWTPETAGNYTVTAILAYGTRYGNVVHEKEVTYTVKENDLTAEIKVEPGTQVLKGTEATLTATASGGAGNYKYRFGYLNSSGTDVILQDFSTKDYVKFTPETSETQVFVEVMDYAGKVVRDAMYVTTLTPAIYSFSQDAYSTAPHTRHAFNISSNVSSYPVQYRVVLKSSTKTITLDGTGSQLVWYPEEEGSYTATAQILYNGSVIVSGGSIDVNIMVPDFQTTVTTDNTVVPVNKAVGINVENSSDIYTYKYSYILNGKEKVIKDFSSDTRAEFTPKTVGNYTIKVVTKRTYNYSEVVDATNESTVELKVVKLSLDSLTASSAETSVGSAVTFTAAANTTEIPVTFKYTATLNGVSEVIATTSGSASWTPKTDGNYVVKATMLYNGKAVQSKDMLYTVNKKVADNYARIYYKGKDSEKVTPMIQYMLSDGQWTNPVKLIAVSTVEGTTHKYSINMGSETSVVVRFCNSKGVVTDDNNGMNYTFAPGWYKVVDGMISVTTKDLIKTSTLVSTASVSSNYATVGNAVTLSCTSTGGTGSYEYSFSYKPFESGTWTTLQGFNTNGSVEFKPGTVGKYAVCIKAKDGSGVTQKKYLVVEFFEALENTSALSAKEIKLGDTVTVNASATGGSGNYKYTVYYKKATSTKWTKVQAANTNAVVDIKPRTAVKYDIKVVVTDTVTKATSDKDLSVTVTE